MSPKAPADKPSVISQALKVISALPTALGNGTNLMTYDGPSRRAEDGDTAGKLTKDPDERYCHIPCPVNPITAIPSRDTMLSLSLTEDPRICCTVWPTLFPSEISSRIVYIGNVCCEQFNTG